MISYSCQYINKGVFFLDRNSFIVYLHNIRDLELVKAILQQNQRILDAAADAKAQQLELTQDNSRNDRLRGILFLCLAIPMLLLGAGLLIWRRIYIQGTYLGFFQFMMRWIGIFLLIAGAATLIKSLLGFTRAARKRRRARAFNAQVEGNAASVQSQIDKFHANHAFYSQEIQKVDALLSEAYSLNILPAPYRNLHSVYYIYEYMSTSQATLEETLLHEHMENGFQRILSRLDTIITQNEKIIRLQRLSNQQASNILASCQNTEMQVRINNQYLRANAFFQQANYLR